VALCGVLRWGEAQQRLEFMAEVCVVEIAGIGGHRPLTPRLNT
jgi:hypothetical protein